MDIAKIIAANLSAWMKDTPSLNTLQKVEEKSGVGFGTVRRTKKGEGNITIENLEMLAKAFKRHPADLLFQPSDIKQNDSYQKSTATTIVAREPTPLPVQTTRQKREAEIIELLSKTDDYGIVAILEKSKEIAKTYPAKSPKTEISSG